jgi:hypothetical protein
VQVDASFETFIQQELAEPQRVSTDDD